MKKWITGLLISSALMASTAFASERTECLKAAKAQFKTDMGACKDLQDPAKKDCKSAAGKSFKAARKACPAKEKKSE